MKPVFESEKISVAECRKILNVNGVKYSDDEIIKIRNWIYMVAEMTVDFLESKTAEDINEIKSLLTQKVKFSENGNSPD